MDRALSHRDGPALTDRTRVRIALAFTAAVALLLIFSGSAFAQAAGSPDEATETTPLGAATRAAGEGADVTTTTDDGSTGGLVRTIIGLAVVIGVIYGITWILKQAKAAKEPQDVGYGLAPAATLSLGGTRSVQLVRAGQEYLLLGVTDDGVSLLRTYTESEALEAGFPVSGDDDDDLGPFKPIGETTTSGFGPQLMERVRELTVRR
ncbi:MAG: flagellar biosynthetic protein FliO [Solirubrobacteraceae bacterium]|nr:flagellar biosynthetic protein FliO [Solirubrobacteraceae bacterium]